MKMIPILVAGTVLLGGCALRSTDHMVHVEGGTFLAGSDSPEADPDERDVHTVAIGDFYISAYEVTQREWKAVMGHNPSVFRGDNLPVQCVSWDMAMQFVKKLNRRTGRHFRLPTQEEWEYAARGGRHRDPSPYSGGSDLPEVGWYSGNSAQMPHKVGRLKPNALGLYDMTGNVHEWCDGLYDAGHYSRDTAMSGELEYLHVRVFRGGSWASDARHCRVANINYNSRDTKNHAVGLRLAEDK